MSGTRDTRSISQNFIRRTQDNDSRGMRAGSFVPRMIRVFNNMVPDYKHLPSIPGSNGPGSDKERFQILKVSLRNINILIFSESITHTHTQYERLAPVASYPV